MVSNISTSWQVICISLPLPLSSSTVLWSSFPRRTLLSLSIMILVHRAGGVFFLVYLELWVLRRNWVNFLNWRPNKGGDEGSNRRFFYLSLSKMRQPCHRCIITNAIFKDNFHVPRYATDTVKTQICIVSQFLLCLYGDFFGISLPSYLKLSIFLKWKYLYFKIRMKALKESNNLFHEKNLNLVIKSKTFTVHKYC